MSRKHIGEQDDVSLFPFLSVLACIIGTLTLLIAALALGQMDTETVVTAEQYEHVQAELVKVRAEVEELKLQTGGDATEQFELAMARSSLELLERQLAAAKKQAAARVQAAGGGIAAPPPETDREAEKELAELEKKIEQLEKLIAERNRPPEEAEVMVQPEGSGVDIDPRFVECRSDSIVLYADGEPRRIPKSKIANDASFLELLKKVADGKRSSIIFLVRSDGIGTYAAARGVAQKNYAKNGKLPVLGRGKIDLSLFEPES